MPVSKVSFLRPQDLQVFSRDYGEMPGTDDLNYMQVFFQTSPQEICGAPSKALSSGRRAEASDRPYHDPVNKEEQS